MAVIDGSIVTVSHLGLIAGLIDDLKIVETIDKNIPKKRSHTISHGLAVKALLLNCLGFVERRLYVMPEYFEDIATERLLAPGIEPEHLNQYVFGETLDRISEFGPTKLFNLVILVILSLVDLGILRLHTDTTSVSATGEYDSDFGTKLIKLVRGHSKDHRDDLKQFVIALSTDQRGIPIHMEALSGNESDKKTLLGAISKIRESIDLDKTVYHIADSAFYTADNLTTLGSHCYWISRVPETILEAKNRISADVTWEPCSDPRYMCSTNFSSYAGIQQKWFLYHSTELKKRQIAHDESRMEKRLEKDQTSLHSLLMKGFACEEDARLAIERWIGKHPRYDASNIGYKVVKQRKNGARGRPKKGEELITRVYPTCTLSYNMEIIRQEQSRMGRFILASNDLSLSPDECLQYYKEQSKVERGFRFLKDDSFHVADVFLENENRIAALSMIMVLCLLIYTFAEWMVRKALDEKNKTVRSQTGKPTKKPSAKWMFQLYRRVRELKEQSGKNIVCRIVNYTEELREISRLLGPNIEKYYT